ncbi:MAG: hypothetical protein J5612_05495 [Paludibacteraceae bacterium]|nr:hypothetical protein [Paludibacteraceae bacterium]
MKKYLLVVILICVAIVFATCSKRDVLDHDADDHMGKDPTRPNDVRALRSDRPFENPEETDTICKEFIKIAE